MVCQSYIPNVPHLLRKTVKEDIKMTNEMIMIKKYIKVVQEIGENISKDKGFLKLQHYILP